MSLFGDMDIWGRIIRAFKMFGFYSIHVFKPIPLSFGYPFSNPADLDKYFWAGIFALIMLMSMISWRRNRIILFGAAIYIFFIFPALQLFGRLVYNASIYDRYLAVALLGICILFERVFANIFNRAARMPFIPPALAAAVIIIFSWITMAYVQTFRSDIESTKNSYEKFPDWPGSSFNYVYSLIEGGELDKAWDITMREKSFLSPAWVRNYFIGWIYLQRGNPEEAVPVLSDSTALAISEGYFPFPGLPLGRALMALGRYESAANEFRQVLSSEIYQPLEMYHARKELEKIKRLQG